MKKKTGNLLLRNEKQLYRSAAKLEWLYLAAGFAISAIVTQNAGMLLLPYILLEICWNAVIYDRRPGQISLGYCIGILLTVDLAATWIFYKESLLVLAVSIAAILICGAFMLVFDFLGWSINTVGRFRPLPCGKAIRLSTRHVLRLVRHSGMNLLFCLLGNASAAPQWVGCAFLSIAGLWGAAAACQWLRCASVDEKYLRVYCGNRARAFLLDELDVKMHDLSFPRYIAFYKDGKKVYTLFLFYEHAIQAYNMLKAKKK